MEKDYEDIYVTESFCCTAEINTTLKIDYSSIKKMSNESLSLYKLWSIYVFQWE